MTKEIIINEKILNIEILIRKNQVMINDLHESYFCEEINSEMDTWKIRSQYYENACVKVCIIGDIVMNLDRSLEELKCVIDFNTDVTGALVQHPEWK